MNSLAVPRIDSCPEETKNEFPVVAFADFLLSRLLRTTTTPCVLHARDSGGESVAWSVGDEVIAETPRLLFRSVLGRFGHHYMGGQLYAGYALAELQQEGLRSVCHFYLGNSGDTGFWIEIHARKA